MARSHYEIDVEVRYHWPVIVWDFGNAGAICWQWAAFFVGSRRIGGMLGFGVRVGPKWSVARTYEQRAI